jgi:hypothetical protein
MPTGHGVCSKRPDDFMRAATGVLAKTMTSRNLSRRLERLEDSLLPVLEEPLTIHIISVDRNGRREDSGIEFKVQQVPKPLRKGPR